MILHQIADDGNTIVDFCSGSGHIGILVAYVLPRCHVLLIDNKEHSLLKAVERVRKLDLKNISIIQSNVDYFKGSFQVERVITRSLFEFGDER